MRIALVLSLGWTLLTAGLLLAGDAVTLAEKFSPGTEYHVTTRVRLKGEILVPVDNKPPQKQEMTGRGDIDYDERILPADGKIAEARTIRQYRDIDFQRKTGDLPQRISLRPEVKRLVVLQRGPVKTSFSPDGALTWGEIDMLRTDVFVPTLAGLLPNRPVRPGESWQVAEAAAAELTGLEKIERGALNGRFELEEYLGGRAVAHVTLTGELTGVNEDGPVRQKLNCRLYFDIRDAFISYLSVNGEHFLLDKNGAEHGKMTGEFVMVRQRTPGNPSLSDTSLARLATEPNPDNTLMLHEEAEMGVKFHHPRTWRVTRVDRGQIVMDHSGGNGLLITVEPLARVPTANAYLTESRGYLEKQKAKVSRVSPPVRLQNAPRELDQFAFDAEIGGQKVVMDYLIARQPNAGATFAARLFESDRDALVKEVERMARSLTLSRKLEAK